MKDERLLNIAKAVLGTFDHRQSFSPGMFEALKPIFGKLGYKSAAVYIVDDFPDRMHLEYTSGVRGFWPDYVVMECNASLFDSLLGSLGGVPGVLAARLYSHGRELGAIAAVMKGEPSDEDREAFDVLSQSMSIMAYIERVRTNGVREREERDLFFAQSLTSRLLVSSSPRLPGLRVGIEHIRSLEAGGDFFEFVPTRDGLIGFIGGCNGKGLRTVMEVCSIMREIHRSLQSAASASETLLRINRLLVTEQRRAYQASLCLFAIDVKRNRLRLAKAGRLGLLLCDNDGSISNISAPGGLFLGMAAKPRIPEEEYDFHPGQSLFCVTEGFYRSRNILGARPQLRWFLSALTHTLKSRRRKPLVNALFGNLDSAAGASPRSSDSMLALSVERVGSHRRSQKSPEQQKN